jgi:hypothetical protein
VWQSSLPPRFLNAPIDLELAIWPLIELVGYNEAAVLAKGRIAAT